MIELKQHVAGLVGLVGDDAFSRTLIELKQGRCRRARRPGRPFSRTMIELKPLRLIAKGFHAVSDL